MNFVALRMLTGTAPSTSASPTTTAAPPIAMAPTT